MHRLKPQPKSRQNLARKLAEIARIGALFIDGDALDNVFASGRDWTSGDDINFRHGPYIEVKRTVLRIERIGDFRYFAAVSLVRQDDPAKCEAIVCGMRNDLGIRPVPMTPAMRRCVRKAEIAVERIPKTGDVRAYAPIKTSEGDTIGFLMVHTALRAG